MSKFFLSFIFSFYIHSYSNQEYPKYILYAEEINQIEYINYFEVNSKQEEEIIHNLILRKISTMNICREILKSSFFCYKSKQSIKNLIRSIEKLL